MLTLRTVGAAIAIPVFLWLAWPSGDNAPDAPPRDWAAEGDARERTGFERGIAEREAAAVDAVQPARVTTDNLSPKATRLFYRADGSMEWGSACALPGGGYFGVHHVTVNGDKAPPVQGPRDPVTAFNEASDWSFIGVDPKTLDANDFPKIRAGMKLFMHGFVARDRRGQIVPGTAYMDDPGPPFWWMELKDKHTDAFGQTIDAEGVLGGFSGSCVLDEQGRIVATTHANGFSKIADTTNTWAMIVPIRDAILEAQGKVDFSTVNPPSSLFRNPLLPKLDPVAVDAQGRMIPVGVR